MLDITLPVADLTAEEIPNPTTTANEVKIIINAIISSVWIPFLTINNFLIIFTIKSLQDGTGA